MSTIVSRTTTQYVRFLTPQGYILWTYDKAAALPVSAGKATKLAGRLQSSANSNHPAKEPAGEYGTEEWSL